MFKLPLVLDRRRLGWVLGQRVMLLTQVGRHSGKVRRTILAVGRFDEPTQEISAVSAWKGSDWYANIATAPALHVEPAWVRYAPLPRTRSPAEITTPLRAYRKTHPIFSRMMGRIPGGNWDSSYEAFLALAHTLRGVAFEPK